MINSIKSTDKLTYNKTKFQKDAPNINTCGRWVIARLSLFLSDDLDLKDFTKLIKTKAKQLKMTNDELYIFSNCKLTFKLFNNISDSIYV